MPFDFWRFMASPSSAGGASRRGGARKRGRKGKPGVPWWISVLFFVALLRVLLGTLILYGLSLAVDEPMPAWFDALILVHGVAMIVALVFILNGFGWARLAWLALAFAQLGFDQGELTRYFLIFDIAALIVLTLPASGRYMAACAGARSARGA